MSIIFQTILITKIYIYIYFAQWREVAKDLEGVIRIGAVNCEDDFMLCRQNGIHSFPSLVMFPAVSIMLKIYFVN